MIKSTAGEDFDCCTGIYGNGICIVFNNVPRYKPETMDLKNEGNLERACINLKGGATKAMDTTEENEKKSEPSAVPSDKNTDGGSKATEARGTRTPATQTESPVDKTTLQEASTEERSEKETKAPSPTPAEEKSPESTERVEVEPPNRPKRGRKSPPERPDEAKQPAKPRRATTRKRRKVT